MNIKNFSHKIKELLDSILHHRGKLNSDEGTSAMDLENIDLLLERIKELSHHHTNDNIELELVQKYLGYGEKILKKIIKEDEKRMGRQHKRFLLSEISPEKENDFSKGITDLHILFGNDENKNVNDKIDFTALRKAATEDED